MKKIAAALFFVFLVAHALAAPTCKLTGETCTDSTPCKTISGVPVCLAGVTPPAGGVNISQTCWNYQDTYNCIKPDAVNYCQPFINASPSCWQTSSICAQMDATFGTGCMQYQQTYQCGNSAMPTAPTNTVQLADTYTLVSTGYDTSTCPSATSSNCTIASTSCTSTTPNPPLPPGISPTAAAPDGCYQQTNTYACSDGTTTSDCGQYSSNPNCSPQSSNCVNTLPNGTCAVNQQTYSCMTSPASTTTTNDCSGTSFCQGGNCFNTGHPADNAFATATALMEAGRQGGVYNQNGIIFSGVDDSCRIRLFGLANCCKTNGGGSGYSNNAVMGFVVQTGAEAIAGGSKYAYDALYKAASNVTWFPQGVKSLLGEPTLSSFQPSLSLYGFTATWTGIAVDGSTNPIVTSTISTTAGSLSSAFSGISQAWNTGTVSLGSAGGFQFSFNEYSLALQVAIMVYEDLTSCNQDEQMLSLKRGQNLCTYVGTYCSQSLNLLVGSICMENTQTYCCYNSLLAKIIEEQGRAQIGKGYGSVQSPDCSGLTTAQFQQIDFTKIDLSQFTAQIMASVVGPNNSGNTQNASGVIQQKILNYYQMGHQ